MDSRQEVGGRVDLGGISLVSALRLSFLEFEMRFEREYRVFYEGLGMVVWNGEGNRIKEGFGWFVGLVKGIMRFKRVYERGGDWGLVRIFVKMDLRLNLVTVV